MTNGPFVPGSAVRGARAYPRAIPAPWEPLHGDAAAARGGGDVFERDPPV